MSCVFVNSDFANWLWNLVKTPSCKVIHALNNKSFKNKERRYEETVGTKTGL